MPRSRPDDDYPEDAPRPRSGNSDRDDDDDTAPRRRSRNRDREDDDDQYDQPRRPRKEKTIINWQDGRLTMLPAPAEPFGLDLAYKATDGGLKELAAFKNLQALNLAYTKVTDTGLKELASLKNLQMLDLMNTEVTDAGLKVLSGLKLHLLFLPYKVTDAGLKLATLSVFPPKPRPPRSPPYVKCVAFSPDGRTLAIGGYNPTHLQLWRIEENAR